MSKDLVKKRPTETATGTGAGLAVYGFATQVGLPPVLAAIAALIVFCVPYVLSAIVDAKRAEKHAARDAALH
jgi:hypothetical protein